MTAATVIIETWSGGSDGSPGTYTDVTSSNIRYRSDDSPFTNDATAPISVPTSGTVFSRWITLGLNITAMGDATNIDNVNFYPEDTLAWTLGTSGGINILQKASAPHGIATADYDVADAGGDIATNHGAATSVADLYATYDSASPMDVDDTDYTATGRTYAVVIEAEVGVGAPAGTQTGETLTFTYDEI